jgi:hypothetical protein
MTNVEDLRDRLVGKRFYDTERDEAFTVVGMTSAPPLALLQYDDGVGWDEAAANFTVDEDTARKAGLDEHGLDSERYRPLGPGPRIEQTCDPEEHDWFPWPNDLWQDIPSDDQRKQVPGHPRDFYSQIARCRKCGLSGSVAGQFGDYGANGHHQTPWFCYECGDVLPGHELRYVGDLTHCPECAAAKQESEGE